MIREPSGKKYAQVQRPLPVDTRRWSEPSAFMRKIWSHFDPSRVDWKISSRPSAEKYASAFSPPAVSFLMFLRWRSADGAAGTAGDGSPARSAEWREAGAAARTASAASQGRRL